jgi:hypothetical protein
MQGFGVLTIQKDKEPRRVRAIQTDAEGSKKELV